MVILNLSSDAHDAVFSTDGGKYKNYFTGKKQKIKTGKKVTIPAWGIWCWCNKINLNIVNDLS
ncbi:MAG: hypothetical protein IPP60_00070 [Sphingobacteriales bacterium]|nr:hypothetical protein [Sphingobacteriales bacterium]